MTSTNFSIVKNTGGRYLGRFDGPNDPNFIALSPNKDDWVIFNQGADLSTTTIDPDVELSNEANSYLGQFNDSVDLVIVNQDLGGNGSDIIVDEVGHPFTNNFTPARQVGDMTYVAANALEVDGAGKATVLIERINDDVFKVISTPGRYEWVGGHNFNGDDHGDLYLPDSGGFTTSLNNTHLQYIGTIDGPNHFIWNPSGYIFFNNTTDQETSIISNKEEISFIAHVRDDAIVSTGISSVPLTVVKNPFGFPLVYEGGVVDPNNIIGIDFNNIPENYHYDIYINIESTDFNIGSISEIIVGENTIKEFPLKTGYEANAEYHIQYTKLTPEIFTQPNNALLRINNISGGDLVFDSLLNFQTKKHWKIVIKRSRLI